MTFTVRLANASIASALDGIIEMLRCPVTHEPLGVMERGGRRLLVNRSKSFAYPVHDSGRVDLWPGSAIKLSDNEAEPCLLPYTTSKP